jgi:hypothetical protein
MDFLPEVKMDFVPSDNESDNEQVDNTVINENVIEDKDDFDEEKDSIENVLPKTKANKEDINVNEIFTLPNNNVIEPNIKLTKKGKPRKVRAPMSEEHKEKLKFARERAMEVRLKKAKERKENLQLEKQEKELLQKQKVKRVEKLKEEVENEPIKELKKEQTFTKKDLEEAQLQAIMNYEKIRKSRKAEKEERKKKEAEEEAIKAQLRRAVAPSKPEYNNPFQNCY